MPYQAQVRERVDKIRLFQGIAGDPTQTLIRKTQQGDSSSTIANEVYDLSLTEKGTLSLRDGCRRDQKSTASINTIFQIFLGGVSHYGILSAGGIDLISMPTRRELEEEDEEIEVSEDYPPGWPRPDAPQDETPPDDPSLPPDEQTCPVGSVFDSSTGGLAFSMIFGGTLPAVQSWFYRETGHRDLVLSLLLDGRPTYFSGYAGGYWYNQIGTCNGQTVQEQLLWPNSEASTKAPGTYTFTQILRQLSSVSSVTGLPLSVLVTLYIYGPAMTITGSNPVEWTVLQGDTTASDKTVTVGNTASTPLTTILRWTAYLDALSMLIGKTAISATSGNTDEGSTTAITVSLNPTGLAVGSYTDSLTVLPETGCGVSSSVVPVTVTVVPVYSGPVYWRKTATTSRTKIDPVVEPKETTVTVTTGFVNKSFPIGGRKFWNLATATGTAIFYLGEARTVGVQERWISYYDRWGALPETFSSLAFDAIGCPTGEDTQTPEETWTRGDGMGSTYIYTNQVKVEYRSTAF